MYEEAKGDCDECGEYIDNDECIYCERCYMVLLDENKELVERINKLGKRIEELTLGRT